MSMINSERTRRYSELHPIQILEDDALFAVSQLDASQTLESKKVTFEQIKQQIDYDLNIVEIAEKSIPDDSELDTGVLIGGYLLRGKKITQESSVVYPTNVPRIIPLLSGFKAIRGRSYTLPFATRGMVLSDLTISSNTPGNFDLLNAVRLDDNTGFIQLTANVSGTGEQSSIIKLSDNLTGIETSILVFHTILVPVMNFNSATVSGNKITVKYRPGYSGSLPTYIGVISPTFTLSENISHNIYYKHDYFNQSEIYRSGSTYTDFVFDIVLNEPYIGTLKIDFIDINQGVSGSTTVDVNYNG